MRSTLESIDIPRLASQLKRIEQLMNDGRFRTIGQIARIIGGTSEAGVSARLRQLRQPPLNYDVQRERVPNSNGLWRYRVARIQMRLI